MKKLIAAAIAAAATAALLAMGPAVEIANGTLYF